MPRCTAMSCGPATSETHIDDSRWPVRELHVARFLQTRKPRRPSRSEHNLRSVLMSGGSARVSESMLTSRAVLRLRRRRARSRQPPFSAKGRSAMSLTVAYGRRRGDERRALHGPRRGWSVPRRRHGSVRRSRKHAAVACRSLARIAPPASLPCFRSVGKSPDRRRRRNRRYRPSMRNDIRGPR